MPTQDKEKTEYYSSRVSFSLTHLLKESQTAAGVVPADPILC